jgi:hypothetical protein
MAIQQSTTGATAGNLTRYETEYRKHLQDTMTYDQFATENFATFEPRGTTVQIAWATKMQPRPTTAVGNETSDFDPQTIRDVTRSMSRIYMHDGAKWHELVSLKSSLDPVGELMKAVKQNAKESIDALARRVATEGSLVLYGDNTHSSRITLDLGTPGDNMSIDRFVEVKSMLGSWQRDDGLMVVMDDFTYSDLLTASSGVLTSRQAYTEEAARIVYNYELATLSDIKIVVSPYAKAFYGAGADNASAVATTVAASVTTPTANTAGSQIIEVASATNISGSKWLTIGTVQTSTESDATILTEIVRVVGIGTGITVNGSAVTGATATSVLIVGKGPGGGLLYDHSVGAAVENGDTVHASIFGTSKSLAVDHFKYSRYGTLVPKFEDGNAKQWTTLSWKYYGNYGRFDESRLVRVETSARGQ